MGYFSQAVLVYSTSINNSVWTHCGHVRCAFCNLSSAYCSFNIADIRRHTDEEKQAKGCSNSQLTKLHFSWVHSNFPTFKKRKSSRKEERLGIGKGRYFLNAPSTYYVYCTCLEPFWDTFLSPYMTTFIVISYYWACQCGLVLWANTVTKPSGIMNITHLWWGVIHELEDKWLFSLASYEEVKPPVGDRVPSSVAH